MPGGMDISFHVYPLSTARRLNQGEDFLLCSTISMVLITIRLSRTLAT
jgi:hypothetical protein